MVWVSWEQSIPALVTPPPLPHVGSSLGQTFLSRMIHVVKASLKPCTASVPGMGSRLPPQPTGACVDPHRPHSRPGHLHHWHLRPHTFPRWLAGQRHPGLGQRMGGRWGARDSSYSAFNTCNCLTFLETDKGWKKSPIRGARTNLGRWWHLPCLCTGPLSSPTRRNPGRVLHPQGRRSWPQRGLQREAGHLGGPGLLSRPAAWLHALHLPL